MRISRRHFLVAGAALPAFAQISGTTIPNPIAPQGPLDYYCPMDKDVRSDKPGKCPKCGMTLLLGIPDQTEYPLDVIITPEHFHAGEKVEIAFTIKNPKDDKTVKDFTIVHEKLFHMFIVSSDLKYWIHDHPVFGEDGVFRYEETFPKPGMYRILGDFFPTGGIPQLVSRTVFVPGKSGEEAISMDVPKLEPDMNVQHGTNTDVEFTLDPPQPIAGLKTLLFLKMKQTANIQRYLGAWAHMMVASDDLIDMMHEHPFIADGGPEMQFNLILPRERTYRIWIQFQRDNVVNTVAINVPVTELK